MLEVRNEVRRFIFLARLATDMTCLRYNADNIYEAWEVGRITHKIVAINKVLGCKRHGAGALFFFRGELRRCAGASNISVDYDRAGDLVVDIWNLSVYIRDVALGVSTSDQKLLREIANNCIGGQARIHVR